MARPSKKVGATKSGNPTMDFVLDYLRRNPRAQYAELKAVAERRGHQIWPITYGRAQAMLGLIKSKPPGRKKKVAAQRAFEAPAAITPRSRPGRPRKQAAPSFGADAIAGLTAAMDELQRLRQALAQIAEIAGQVER